MHVAYITYVHNLHTMHITNSLRGRQYSSCSLDSTVYKHNKDIFLTAANRPTSKAHSQITHQMPEQLNAKFETGNFEGKQHNI